MKSVQMGARRTARGGRSVLLCALATAALACSAPPPPSGAPAEVGTSPTPAAGPSSTASPGDIDPVLLQPLTMLGPCTAEPNVLDEEPVDGLLLPEDAVLTSQQSDGPLTTVKGYIPMTPIQVRVFYQRQTEFEVLQIEDEIQESEMLLADGNHRLFVKAQAICELGSVFLAVVAPEGGGAEVPVPAGGAAGGS